MEQFSFQNFADLAGSVVNFFSAFYDVLTTKTVFDIPLIIVLLGGGLVAYVTVALISWVLPT